MLTGTATSGEGLVVAIAKCADNRATGRRRAYRGKAKARTAAKADPTLRSEAMAAAAKALTARAALYRGTWVGKALLAKVAGLVAVVVKVAGVMGKVAGTDVKVVGVMAKVEKVSQTAVERTAVAVKADEKAGKAVILVRLLSTTEKGTMVWLLTTPTWIA